MTSSNASRRLLLCVALLSVSVLSCTGPEPVEERFDVVEATIPEMQRAMEEGRVTSRELVEAHLLRIAVYEDQVNAVISCHSIGPPRKGITCWDVDYRSNIDLINLLIKNALQMIAQTKSPAVSEEMAGLDGLSIFPCRFSACGAV